PFDQFLLNIEAWRIGTVSKQQFIEKNYQYYKQLTDHHVYDLIRFVIENRSQFSSELSSLAQCLFYRQLPKTYAIEEPGQLQMLDDFIKNASYPSWQLGILHEEVILYSINDRGILVTDDHEQYSLDHYSPVIKAREGYAEFKHYLYIHDDIKTDPPIKKLTQLLNQSFTMEAISIV